MSNFDQALAFVLQNEGGLTNDPNDAGGLTNLGLTKQDIADYQGIPINQVPDSAITGLTPALAAPIYRKNYWDPLNLDAEPDANLATVIFDIGVNRGVRAVTRDIRNAGHAPLLKALIKADVLAYASIVSNNPPQVVFLNGWMNRAMRYLDFI